MTEPETTSTTRIVEWASIEGVFAGAGEVGAGGVLLLGNGFSANIWGAFGYRTLLERSGLDGTARELFGSRTNFETVLAELSTTRRVLGVATPKQEELLVLVEALAKEVRDGLLDAVGQVHPDANQLVAGRTGQGRFGTLGLGLQVLDELAKYLPRYSKTFVTNYDLISYWAAVQSGVADLFPGSEPFEVERAEWWLANNSQPKIFFLHGALHLWRSLVSNVEGKHTASPNQALLDVVRASVEQPDVLPLFISEGSSAEKVARISASPYLSFCSRELADAEAPMTVLGQALGESDQHICQAIERHPARKVAIGIYVGEVEETDRPTELLTRATEIHGRLPRCRDVVFFDSAEHALISPRLHCSR